ncbi:hypothetical protein [Algicella marina]|uniref:Uncharacterized protein n=1 Tax=Algicella marina TaxID=2683284 RepID=A0A6P1T5Z7_9RHOB|nr:hypothetical protein [Algicella marina]QHQ37110.1 hypothetical protein GO499_18950 [Algicella marina]
MRDYLTQPGIAGLLAMLLIAFFLVSGRARVGMLLGMLLSVVVVGVILQRQDAFDPPAPGEFRAPEAAEEEPEVEMPRLTASQRAGAQRLAIGAVRQGRLTGAGVAVYRLPRGNFEVLVRGGGVLASLHEAAGGDIATYRPDPKGATIRPDGAYLRVGNSGARSGWYEVRFVRKE